MKHIVLFLALASCLAFDKESMLKHNKIGKEPVGQISVASVCDECQSWVHRFHEAAKDPKKLEELKMILRVLCHETSYVEECRMFVANLDEIIKKLDPYLNDTHKVCKAIHMCSNTRLDAFHRIGLLYARRALNEEEGVKDLVCDECQFAARELKVIVEDKDKQKEIRDFLSQNVCLHLGSYRGMCDELIDQFLPEVFQELDSLLADPRQACSDAGFCPKLALPRETTTAFVKTSIHPVYAFFKGAGTMQTPAGSVLMSCFECKILLKIFVTTLLADRNNIAASMKALICHHLIPSNYSAGCNDFLSLYLPTALYMTFKQLIPGEVCLKAKLCDSTSLSRIAQLKESETQSLSCVSCSSLQNYFKTAMDRPEAIGLQHFIIEEVKRSVCDRVGNFGRLCDRYVKAVVPRLLTKWSDLHKMEGVCQKVGLMKRLNCSPYNHAAIAFVVPRNRQAFKN